MNANRHIPPMLDIVKKVSNENKVYIFNVGPWAQSRLLGSLGQFFIEPCPEGKDYSKPIVLNGIVREYYPINEMKMEPIDEDGDFIAQQILGVGPHLSPRASFVPYGVFISHNNPPLKAEVEKAKGELHKLFLELVTQADLAYSMGPKSADDTIRPETHFVAARALGKTETDCAWLKNAVVPAERKECPSCGARYKLGLILCRECKFILDPKKYAENKASFAS